MMRQKSKKMMRNALCAVSITLVTLTAKPAYAYDLPAVNLGFTSFLDGGPPAGPGFYFQNYTQYYWSSRLNDGDGDRIPLAGTDIDVLVNVFQGIYMSDKTLLGGNPGVNTNLPVVAASTSFDTGVPGPEANNAGLGDLLVGPFLQWGPYIGENGPTFMHRVELQTIWPTGEYDSNREINPGSNFFSFNPYWAATVWITPKWTASWRLHYLWNAENNDPNRGFVGANDTQAGQALHANWATSYEVTPKLRLGINGYALKQITDTKVDGTSVSGRKEAVFAFGPGLLYSFSRDQHIFVNGYYEAHTENRPKGSSVLVRYVTHF